MENEITSVYGLKPLERRRSRTREIIKVLASGFIAVTVAGVLLLSNCGNTANQAEKIPKPPAKSAHLGLTLVPIQYKVQPGDTVSDIAEKFLNRWPEGTPAAVVREAIVERNAKDMPNGKVLQSGTTIIVPTWIEKGVEK